MKKNILCVKFLFLAVFACSCNLSIFSAGDIPDYTINSTGLPWFGKSTEVQKDKPANSSHYLIQ